MKRKSGRSTFTTEIVLNDEDVLVEVKFTWSCDFAGDTDPAVDISEVCRPDTGDELIFQTLPQSEQEHLEDQAREDAIDAAFEMAG